MNPSQEPLIRAQSNSDNIVNIANSSPTHLTIDNIFTRIGFGYYQIKAYIIIGLILIANGAEFLILSLLQNILTTQWALTPLQSTFITVTVFLFFLLGSLLSGRISDFYGRRQPLITLTMAMYVLGMVSAFMPNYLGLVIARSCYGFVLGMLLPMCFTYLAEITPMEGRGRCLVFAGGFFVLGELVTCGVSLFTLDGMYSGNWRLLLLWMAQPALISWIGILVVLNESPRFLIIARRDYNQGRAILKTIAIQNRVNLTLQEEQIENLNKWVKSQAILKRRELAKFRGLFKLDIRTTTVLLWAIWFIVFLCYYGIIYVLPRIVSALDLDQVYLNNDQDLWNITFPVLGELPAVIIAAAVVEWNYLGRRRSMMAGFALGAVFCVMASLVTFFDLWVILIRVVLCGVLLIAASYTVEIYSTPIRVTGLAMASAVGRLGAAVMPLVAQVLINVNPRAPLVLFGVLCVFGAIGCKMMPYETMKKELDYEYKREEIVGTSEVEPSPEAQV